MNMPVMVFFAVAATASAAQVKEVAKFQNQQITGVGVSQKSGRILTGHVSLLYMS